MPANDDVAMPLSLGTYTWSVESLREGGGTGLEQACPREGWSRGRPLVSDDYASLGVLVGGAPRGGGRACAGKARPLEGEITLCQRRDRGGVRDARTLGAVAVR